MAGSSSSGAFPGLHIPRARNPLSLPSAVGQQLPLPVHAVAASSRRGGGNQQPPATSRLTWSFAFCALFAMGAFFIAHVILSSWLISEESLLERSRLTSFRKHQ